MSLRSYEAEAVDPEVRGTDVAVVLVSSEKKCLILIGQLLGVTCSSSYIPPTPPPCTPYFKSIMYYVLCMLCVRISPV